MIKDIWANYGYLIMYWNSQLKLTMKVTFTQTKCFYYKYYYLKKRYMSSTHLAPEGVGRQRPPLRQVCRVQVGVTVSGEQPHPVWMPSLGPTTADVLASIRVKPSSSDFLTQQPPSQLVWEASWHVPIPTCVMLTPDALLIWARHTWVVDVRQEFHNSSQAARVRLPDLNPHWKSVVHYEKEGTGGGH